MLVVGMAQYDPKHVLSPKIQRILESITIWGISYMSHKKCLKMWKASLAWINWLVLSHHNPVFYLLGGLWPLNLRAAKACLSKFDTQSTFHYYFSFFWGEEMVLFCWSPVFLLITPYISCRKQLLQLLKKSALGLMKLTVGDKVWCLDNVR